MSVPTLVRDLCRRGRLVLVCTALQAAIAAAPAAAAQPGDAAPAISVVSSEGKQLTLDQLRGKVVYLDFWASWCGPCRHTLPWMNELQRKYGKQGLQVVAVNLDKDSTKAIEMLKEVKPEFLVAFDPQGESARAYKLPTMPSSYILDASGRVTAVHPGFREGDGEALETMISGLLSKSGGA